MVNLAIGEQTWAYARVSAGAAAVVLLNNGNEPAPFDCNVAATGLADAAVLADRLGVVREVVVESGRLKATLPPRSGAVLMARQ
jgi:hypothetical protein